MIPCDALLNHTHDLIFKLDDEGHILWANQTSFRVLGYAAGELEQQAIHSLLTLDSREEWEMCRDTATQGVPVEGANLTLITADKELLRAETRVRQATADELAASSDPLPEPGRSVLFVYLRSLTEQQQVRQALRESEKRLRTVMSSLPDILLIIDDKGRYRQIYTANDELLAAPRQQLIGRSVEEVLPADVAARGMAVVRSVLSSRTTAEHDYALEFPDGTRWFSARVVPFGSELDPRVLWAARDTTDLHRAREKLREDEQLLRSLLELETKAREVIAYEIHDGFIQHAIGTQMWLQTIVAMPDPLPESVATAVGVARQSIQHAIEDARSMLGDLRPATAQGTGITNGIRQVIKMFQDRSNTRITFTCQHTIPELLPLLENQVIRIVQESLNNVRRHSQAKTAEVVLSLQSDHIRVEVIDDGIGFDPKNVGAHHYGLEGIRQRAVVFGGKASIASSKGQGTRVTVEMPLIDPERED